MAQINYFKNATEFVEFKPGDIIFDQDQPGTVMYVVHQGEVGIYRDDRLLEICTPGQIIGEMALIDMAHRSARAIARTDCKLIEVDKNRFLFLVQETPTFALQVMHLLAERLRRMTIGQDDLYSTTEYAAVVADPED